MRQQSAATASQCAAFLIKNRGNYCAPTAINFITATLNQWS